MPKKSKLQLKCQNNSLKKNCITPSPSDLDDSKLISQINQKFENNI